MSKGKIALVVVIACAIASFFYFDLSSYLTLDAIKAQREGLVTSFQNNPLGVSAVFFFAYIAVTALSLPGAALMTLLAGAIFGLFWGTVIVSFASSIGATLAFLVSRYLLRDWCQTKMSKWLDPINKGIEKEGAFYLFTMRLVPAIPFVVINLVMGLTPIATRTFYWVSQLGMLLGTIVYVNVGTQLAQIESLSGILSPTLIASFVLLGVFPLIAKKLVGALRPASS